MKFIKIWTSLAAFGLLLILYLSLAPDTDQMPTFIFQDKVQHLIAYSVASLYLHQLTLNRFPWKTSLLLLAYSALIEALQTMTETRSAEAYDLVANAIGIFAGYVISRSAGNILLGLDHWLSGFTKKTG